MLAPAKDREWKAKLMEGKFTPAGLPQSRRDLNAKVRLAVLLSTQFDRNEAKHHFACEQFVAWIVKSHNPGNPGGVISIRTGNTRRCMLGSTIGRSPPPSGEPNPMYSVMWGNGPKVVEFSKNYGDLHNPKEGFAALLVCREAETACPKVDGAGIRVELPYLDPKAYDGAAFEAGKYAERRDDIGRFMLSALMQAKQRMDAAKPTTGP